MPKKISVRPAMGSEGDGFVVWVYGRKVQIQLAYPNYYDRLRAIDETVLAWHVAMEQVR